MQLRGFTFTSGSSKLLVLNIKREKRYNKFSHCDALIGRIDSYVQHITNQRPSAFPVREMDQLHSKVKPVFQISVKQ